MKLPISVALCGLLGSANGLRGGYLYRPQFCNSKLEESTGRPDGSTFILPNVTLEECAEACNAGAWCRGFERVTNTTDVPANGVLKIEPLDCLLLKHEVEFENINGGKGCDGVVMALDLFERPQCEWQVKADDRRCAGLTETFAMELPFIPAPSEWSGGCTGNILDETPGSFTRDSCLYKCIEQPDYRCRAYQVEADGACTTFQGAVTRAAGADSEAKCFIVDEANKEASMFAACRQYMEGVKTCGLEYSYSPDSPDQCTCARSWPFNDQIEKLTRYECEPQADSGFVTYEVSCADSVVTLAPTQAPTVFVAAPFSPGSFSLMVFILATVASLGAIAAVMVLIIMFRKDKRERKGRKREIVPPQSSRSSSENPGFMPPSFSYQGNRGAPQVEPYARREPVERSNSSENTFATLFERKREESMRKKEQERRRKASNNNPPMYVTKPNKANQSSFIRHPVGKPEHGERTESEDQLEDISWLDAKNLAKELGINNTYGSREQLLVRIGTELSKGSKLSRHGTIPEFLSETASYGDDFSVYNSPIPEHSNRHRGSTFSGSEADC